MRPQHHEHALLFVALALAGCRNDSIGTLPSEPRPSLLASRHAAGDPPRFSDWSTAVHLDAPINSPCQDQTPTLSRDQLALYFISNRQGGLGNDTPDGCQDTFDLWVARRASRESPWDNPVNLGSPVNTPANEAGPALSPDGRLLFFYRFEGAGGQRDIYVARRAHRKHAVVWDAPVNLGPNVNTTASEEGPSYLRRGADGTAVLFFDRGATPLESDIYSVPVDRRGTPRGPAMPVPELNSSVEDNHVSVRADGREIFFDSRRPGSTGFDIWTSTRPSVHDAWSTPVNLGAPVNSQFNEFHPNLSFDGRTLLFISGMNRKPNLGGFDIWMATRTPLGDVDREADELE